MNKQRSLITWNVRLAFLAAGGLVISVLLILLLAAYFSNKNASGAAPNTGGGNYHYPAKSLVGAPLDVVGQYAVEYAQHQHVFAGTPQVVLVRPIQQAERPSLGLGCPQTQLTVEEPPEVLVVLKGDFDVSKAIGGMSASSSRHDKYVAYIFDEWSAAHTTLVSSLNGGAFRAVLNDPSLPPDGPNDAAPLICPTSQPAQLQHYGDTAPTVGVP